MNLSREKAEKLIMEIALTEKKLFGLKEELACDHVFEYSYGDNISTTGPTGIWKHCFQCAYSELVGHRGRKDDVIYNGGEVPEKIGSRYHP